MKNNKIKTLSISAIIISICLACIILTVGVVIKEKNKETEEWILHSYGNNVALYNGDQIVEVYGSISINTLPLADKKQLDNGIIFQTREEAISAIEDYDG